MQPKSVKDHLGREYPTRKAMAEAWGICPTTLIGRLSRGWSLKDALTTLAMGATVSRDHLGTDYPTFKEMAHAWGLDVSTLNHRLDKGMSLEEALTTPTRPWRRRVPGWDFATDKFLTKKGAKV